MTCALIMQALYSVRVSLAPITSVKFLTSNELAVGHFKTRGFELLDCTSSFSTIRQYTRNQPTFCHVTFAGSDGFSLIGPDTLSKKVFSH
ncbi:hypothetical protein HZS_5701 [Henneguya salminicola]|nr:hypothetical protein HZS_5701 [Henneguya salminicola]